jgi:hypothetical protein
MLFVVENSSKKMILESLLNYVLKSNFVLLDKVAILNLNDISSLESLTVLDDF